MRPEATFLRSSIHFYNARSVESYFGASELQPFVLNTVLDRRRAEGDTSDSLNFVLFMMPFSVRPSRWAEGF